MIEKEAIELATATAFLKLYNIEFHESYRIVEQSDAPDIRCENNLHELLNLEITLTEDRQKDIAALLGRSDHRGIDALRQAQNPDTTGATFPFGSSLSGNTSAMLISRIAAKLNKDYGSRVALVVRDTSPVGWDWGSVMEQVRDELDLSRNPFDMGIWLLSSHPETLYRLKTGKL